MEAGRSEGRAKGGVTGSLWSSEGFLAENGILEVKQCERGRTVSGGVEIRLSQFTSLVHAA